MKTIKINSYEDISDNFTGIAEYPGGRKFYYKNGKRHRLDGPAIEYPDGRKSYYVDGKLHRLDGPAIEWFDGTKSYYVDGKLHRVDGPAYECFDGTKEYYIHDKQVTKEAQELLYSLMKLKGMIK